MPLPKAGQAVESTKEPEPIKTSVVQEQDDERQGLPSASELQRVVHCPGYLNAKKEFPPLGSPPDDGSAEAGTRAHELLEAVVDGTEISFDDEPARMRWVLEQCAKQAEAVISSIFKDKKPKRLKEQRFWLGGKAAGQPVFSGKVDLMAYDPDSGIWVLIDYKTGQGIYPKASRNWQLHGLLAAAAYANATGQVDLGSNITEAYAFLVQPLVSKRPKGTKLGGDEIARVQASIWTALNQAKHSDAPRIPGTWCKYCPAAHACPEGQLHPIAVSASHPAEVTELTPAQVVQVLTRIPAFEDVIKRLKAYARQLADQGNLPGYEIKEKSGGYRVEDVDALLDKIRDHVSRDDLFGKKCTTIHASRVKDLWIRRAAMAQDKKLKEMEEVWQAEMVPLLEKKPKIKTLTKVKE